MVLGPGGPRVRFLGLPPFPSFILLLPLLHSFRVRFPRGNSGTTAPSETGRHRRGGNGRRSPRRTGGDNGGRPPRKTGGRAYSSPSSSSGTDGADNWTRRQLKGRSANCERRKSTTHSSTAHPATRTHGHLKEATYREITILRRRTQITVPILVDQHLKRYFFLYCVTCRIW